MANNTTQDFIKRIDLTALTEVTGSQMNQLIDTAHPASNKGLTIVTTDTADDVPDVPNPDVEFEGITPTDWYRYIWIRKPFPGSTQKTKLYVWRESDPAVGVPLKWELVVDVVSLQNSIENALEQAALAQDAADAASASAAAASALANAAQATANEANTNAEIAINTSGDNSTAIVALDGRVTELENRPTPLPVSQGGTGQASIQAAVNGLGLGLTPRAQYFVSERYGQGVNGPNSVAGTDVKRILNTISGLEPSSMTGVCTLNTDSTIDLLPGKWSFRFSFPAGGAAGGFHQAKLVKDSDGSLLLPGTTEFASTTTAPTRSLVEGYILLTATTKVKFVHKTQNLLSFGRAGSLNEPEVFGTGIIGWHTNS